MNKKRFLQSVRIACILLALTSLSGAVLVALFYNGILRFNYPSRKTYPVHGVDVSSWQGEIDWPLLAAQGVDFAFIKATEGSSHTDSRFDYNWQGAANAGVAAGAYHFFSFDSAGKTQAEHFIATVPRTQGALPPVVDIEFYGDKAANPPTGSEVAPQLSELLQLLEAHYGKPPILYATAESYRLYLQDSYSENPIWIRDIFRKPTLPDGRDWTFWQYTNRGRLKGYSGNERYIDINLFYDSPEKFAELTR